jgi:hypothetical protein
MALRKRDGRPSLTFEEANALTKDMLRERLLHPGWPIRCFCGLYGQPWPEYGVQIKDDDLTHTSTVCAHPSEFPDLEEGEE